MNIKHNNSLNVASDTITTGDGDGRERTDATLQTYRESLGLNQTELAGLLGITASRLADVEDGVIQPDNEILDFMQDRRMTLIEEIQSFLAEEQRMRQAGETDPKTGQWTFDLYHSQLEYEAANPPTHISEYQTWNQAYRIIGLLMQALGYEINYRYMHEDSE
jgi:transcriptional regulator with XRE-family HTH domain